MTDFVAEAVPPQDSVIAIRKTTTCQFCGKVFVRESWAARHNCPQKKKFALKNNVVITQAYGVWKYWMRKGNIIRKNKRDPSMDAFIKSPMYKVFVDMIPFVREHGITAYNYIDWIVEKRIPKTQWLSDSPALMKAYYVYVREYEDPELQARTTAREITKWMLDHPGKNADDFISSLSATTVLSYVKSGVLTPWVIFSYAPIVNRWLGDDTYNRTCYFEIDKLVNCTYWSDKVMADDAGIDIVNEIMDSEVGKIGNDL